ncbi:MAG: hypothetical protein GIW99_06890 [Candidatus Eremiobacteraeota bacterium]|nr:hypothetical protein [Candidatus Eremiobacteraeota bacterium]MBC5827391.1 hypothetical protein [Candidatus Eremiobacteraeota bacterium]
MSQFDAVRAVANAVLYEGYLLYPYTASATKNQMRWQFGVLVPQACSDDLSEPSSMQTEVLVEPRGTPVLDVAVRFLAVQTRSVERDGTEDRPYDEAIEEEVRCGPFRWPDGQASRQTHISIPASERFDPVPEGSQSGGRFVRRRRALDGTIAVSGEQLDGLIKYRIRIENHSLLDRQGKPLVRADALRSAFVSTHTLLAVKDGVFLSLIDPPTGAAAPAARCQNQHTWPVLVGGGAEDPHRGPLVLSSPIILYDRPKIAVQSDGDKFDGTEIDELLNLSVQCMTDEEKKEARETDDHARTIIDRADSMAPEQLAKMHGVLQYLEGVGRPGALGNGGTESLGAHGAVAGTGLDVDFPTWGTGSDAVVAGMTKRAAGPPASLEEDGVAGSGQIYVAGKKIETGSRVRLRPKRRADSWDMFLAGKTAKVSGVYEDFENQLYVAVSVDDDPATEMHEWYGRHLFFYPDEVEPLDDRP